MRATFDEVKFKPHILATAVLLALLLLGNVGILVFLVIRDIADELTETIVQEAELEAYRIHNTIEEIVLMSTSRQLSELRVEDSELIEDVDKLFDRGETYLYCMVLDLEGNVIFRRDADRAQITFIEEVPDYVLKSPLSANREIIAKIGGETEKIHAIWIPIVIQDEHVGTFALGVSKVLIHEKMERITAKLIREYLVAGASIIIIVVVVFLLILRSVRKARELEAHIQRTNRLIYVGTLASGLGHEIRNSLNAIQINAQMLEEVIKDVGREKVEMKLDLLESIKIGVGELDNLLSEFLRFAKPSKLKLEEIDINALIGQVLRFVEGECGKNGVRVISNFESNLPSLEGDAHHLRQVFLNLMLNANQAMPQGGTLAVTTRALDESIAIDITDTGVGIPEEEQRRVFDLFYSTKKGGTGLGLPIAQRIVEEHRGRITFKSQVGSGTTFRVSLPVGN